MAGVLPLTALAWLAATAPAGAGGIAPPALEAFIAEADRWLFAGDPAPADLPIRLRRLPPVERLSAIAYLRRIGLVEGRGFDTAFTLAPVEPAP